MLRLAADAGRRRLLLLMDVLLAACLRWSVFLFDFCGGAAAAVLCVGGVRI